jgi:hypothetical protein
MKTNLITHIQDIIRGIKFIYDDTLDVTPDFMKDACNAMNMKTVLERSLYVVAEEGVLQKDGDEAVQG